MSKPDLRVGEEEAALVEPVPGGSSAATQPANGLGTIEDVLPGEAAVARAARRSLEGRSRGLPRIWPFLGPAFIAAVAYIDPGNFATNIAGGAKFGYLLLWVVLAANLIAMVVQTQSAKLGIATGKNLPERAATFSLAVPRSASGSRPRSWRCRLTSPRWSVRPSASTSSSGSRCSRPA